MQGDRLVTAVSEALQGRPPIVGQPAARLRALADAYPELVDELVDATSRLKGMWHVMTAVEALEVKARGIVYGVRPKQGPDPVAKAVVVRRLLAQELSAGEDQADPVKVAELRAELERWESHPGGQGTA